MWEISQVIITVNSIYVIPFTTSGYTQVPILMYLMRWLHAYLLLGLEPAVRSRALYSYSIPITSSCHHHAVKLYSCQLTELKHKCVQL